MFGYTHESCVDWCVEEYVYDVNIRRSFDTLHEQTWKDISAELRACWHRGTSSTRPGVVVAKRVRPFRIRTVYYV